MKVYSYLQSGIPVVATDLLTHTQIMDARVAVLAAPIPEEFANGILRLLNDRALREELGHSAQRLVESQFSYGAFKQKINRLYDWLQSGESTFLGELPIMPVSANVQR